MSAILTNEESRVTELFLHVLDLGLRVILRLLQQRRLVDQVLHLRLHLRDVEPRHRELLLNLALVGRRESVRLLQLVRILGNDRSDFAC